MPGFVTLSNLGQMIGKTIIDDKWQTSFGNHCYTRT